MMTYVFSVAQWARLVDIHAKDSVIKFLCYEKSEWKVPEMRRTGYLKHAPSHKFWNSSTEITTGMSELQNKHSK